jgi:hypothetical protein
MQLLAYSYRSTRQLFFSFFIHRLCALALLYRLSSYALAVHLTHVVVHLILPLAASSCSQVGILRWPSWLGSSTSASWRVRIRKRGRLAKKGVVRRGGPERAYQLFFQSHLQPGLHVQMGLHGHHLFPQGSFLGGLGDESVGLWAFLGSVFEFERRGKN